MSSDARPITILMADDDPDDRLLARRALEKHGLAEALVREAARERAVEADPAVAGGAERPEREVLRAAAAAAVLRADRRRQGLGPH